MPDSRPATSNASLILSACFFAATDWFTNSIVGYVQFSWNIRIHGWSNKELKYFELDLAIETFAALCGGLVVLLVQAYGSRNAASRRYTLAFSVVMGLLFCGARWAIWGIAIAASVELTVPLYLAMFIALAAASAFAICRFRWGSREQVRRGFPVLISSQKPPSHPDKSSPPSSP